MAYSDAFITEALIRLAINKYDFEKTAKELGDVTSMTLRRWENNKNFIKKRAVPDLLDRAIERMLMVIPEKWDGNSWAIALGILIDKWLILQGEPINRTESLVRGLKDVTPDDRDAIIREAEEILARVRAKGSDISPGKFDGE